MLHIAVSDISQGQNWRCVFKKVQYRLCHCVLLHQIYHKHKTGVMYSKRCNIALCLCISLHLLYHEDKTAVVYSKRCNIPYAFAYRCICYITRIKLVLCIQHGTVSPLEFVHKVQLLKLRGLCTCMRDY